MTLIGLSLLLVGGIITLIFGVLSLAIPKHIHYVVGLWLIIMGVVALVAYFT